jgi:glycine cleavage system H protein
LKPARPPDRLRPLTTFPTPERDVSEIPQDLLYTEDHEYLKPAGEPGVVYIGITDYAQGELGDIVFVELPKVGATFKKHDVFGTIEAVKAVSELFAPVSGEVLEINGRLDAEPAVVNTKPYDDGWMIKLRMTDESERSGLLDAAGYKSKVG